MNIKEWEEYKDFIKYLKKKKISEFIKLNEIISYIFNDNGKKIRPLILLLSCEIVCNNYKKALDASIAIEAIHTASLIYDDIFDNGIIRRNKLSMHKKYNINTAILCSNILISYSIVNISKYSSYIINKFGKLGIDLCVGEIIDIKNNKTNSIKVYLDCIKKKTASLFEFCAYIGCNIGNGNNTEIKSIKKFGMYYGMAYQLIDDLLEDLNSVEDKKSIYKSNSLYFLYSNIMNKKNALEKCTFIIDKYLTYAENELFIFKNENKAKIKLKQLIYYLKNINKKIIKKYKM